MIALGLRLTVRGGREALTRLIVIAAGVMVGVLLLLTALAGFTALRAQDSRTGWLATSTHNHRPNRTDPTVAPLWWRRSTDQFHTRALKGSISPRPD